MDLFNSKKLRNLLHHDGVVHYYGKIYSGNEAQYYFERMMKDIEWKNDEAIIFGRHIITKRKAAWYGDHEYAYTYSNATKVALPWTKELLELKQRVESFTKSSYNSCLLNLYHTGDEGMAWHSDDEKALAKDSSIASLTFGAERNFLFRHKESKQKISILLESGSLLVMKGETQTYWQHRLPPTKKVKHPRVNLTFRTMQMEVRVRS
jgi:alkylated DNA repair dioxygenase AlkB